MRILKRLRMFANALTSRASVESELDDEMRHHIEMAAEHHRRRGLSDVEARRRARVDFGSVEQHKEAMREGRGVRGLERVAFDLRFAARQLRATPAFTCAAVLTLALGIGGNAAVFSVVNGILLRPLSYPDADRLVSIGHLTRGGDLPPRLPNSSATHTVYEPDARSFEGMALYTSSQGSLTGGTGSPEWIGVVWATRTLFGVLRVPAALGRTFTGDEDRPGGPRVAIISHGLWRQRFAGDSSILGRPITLDGTQHAIVGVMPPGFAFPTPAAQVWVPMRVDRADLSGFFLPGIARLRHGVTPEQASRELEQLLPRVTAVVDFLTLETLRDAGIRPHVRPYLDDVVGSIRPVLWSLGAMTGLVLLIACVNVASLLLVRGEGRRREIAVRIALGAERRHLMGQSLAESAILVLGGGALGALLAAVAIKVLPAFAPAVVPRLANIRIDGTVIVAMTAVAAGIAIVFGLLPFMRARSIAPAAAFRGGDRAVTSDRRGARLRQVLVASQIAMATVLLMASGLVLRSFAKLRAVDPGFRADGVVTFRISLPAARYRTSGDVARFHYDLLDRIRALPGVMAAGGTNRLPLAGVTTEVDPVRVDGRAYGNGLPPLAEMRVATPGYFEAMGIRRTVGRDFDRADTERRTGAVLITDALARRLMESRAAIGARVAHGLADVRGAKPWSDVVGVVGDVHGVSLDKEPTGAVYYPMVNRPGVDMEWLARSMVYAVRTTSAPATVIAAVRRELEQLDAQLPVAETRTLASVVESARAGMQFSAIGFGVAALIGLFMGAIGLYGVVSSVTTQRTREIGVRIALGATPSSVRTAVVRGGLAVSVVGLAAGSIVAISLRGVAAPLLYDVAPVDAATLAGVAVVLLAVAAFAAWLPARRAAKLDPVRALRGD